MGLELDHIVHFIKSHPSEAIREWEELGYKAVMGGRHELWGTYNSLLYMGSSYIEYLAIEKIEIASQSNNPLIKQLVRDIGKGEGFGQICFRTTNMNQLQSELQRLGYSTSSFEGSRKRSDNQMIRWKMLFILEESSLPYPFFIEWEQNNEDRLNDLSNLGFLTEKLKTTDVNSIQILVNDVKSTVNEWSALLKAPITLLDDKKGVIQLGHTELLFSRQENNELQTLLKENRPYLVTFSPSLLENPLTLFGATYK
ncbi:VOC family protein [Bacillus sp. 31A1R]|uniref:VOC family protein n=1 Tax=Robertmurraya mangrovi TaxID=3098077 RepID=A0ABU5IWX7_9BACI|nr:VOC family protein [Bacillus sp. 31A1R]MDZ5471637.1 VOC family protein [Bacillus sp. 31A1R]